MVQNAKKKIEWKPILAKLLTSNPFDFNREKEYPVITNTFSLLLSDKFWIKTRKKNVGCS